MRGLLRSRRGSARWRGGSDQADGPDDDPGQHEDDDEDLHPDPEGRHAVSVEAWSEDERRSRRLLFSPELGAGIVGESALVRREVRVVVAAKRVPSWVSR